MALELPQGPNAEDVEAAAAGEAVVDDEASRGEAPNNQVATINLL